MKPANWTRRKLLSQTSAAAASALAPHRLFALMPGQPAKAAAVPFSRFTDVAAAAGLTHPTIFA